MLPHGSLIFALATLLPITGTPKKDFSFPSEPPTFCNPFLMTTAGIAGSRSYVRLKFELEALGAAQASDDAMQKTFSDMTADDPTLIFEAILSGERDSRDALNCAAMIMDRYKPETRNDDLVRVAMETVFLEEREADAGLLDYGKQRALHVGLNSTRQDGLKRAEQLSKLSSTKKDAANDLILTTQASLMNALDLTGPETEAVSSMTLSCSERADLIESSTVLAKSDGDAYQQAASLMTHVLNEYGCKS